MDPSVSDARRSLLSAPSPASAEASVPVHRSLTPAQRAKRRWMLVLCQTAYFVTITLLYQIAPFFPVYAKKELGLTDATIGVVFAFLPCASCIMAPITGYLLQLLGYFAVLVGGGVFVAVGTIGFGFSTALGGFLAFRAIQGVGAACTYSSTSAIMARLFPGDIEKIFAFQELIGNIGFALGPTIGAGLFQLGGFHMSFIVLTALHFGVMILMMATWVPIPPAPRPPQRHDSEGGHASIERKIVGVREVLRMRHILITVICSALISSAFGFMDPVLSEHFLQVLGKVSPATMGLMFAFPTVTMAIATLLIPKTTALLTKHVTLALGLLVMGFAFLTVGPVIKVSSNPWVQQLIALGLAGIASSWGWVPCMPYMIEGIPPEMGHGAIDMISAMFNGGASLGEALGPILGGSLTGVIGFKSACLAYAILFLLYGVIFWIVAPDTSARDRVMPYTDYDANPGISAARISRRYSTVSVASCPVDELERQAPLAARERSRSMLTGGMR